MSKLFGRISFTNILILSAIIFNLVACCREDSKQASQKQQILIDSPTERRQQAQKLIEKYSMAEWQNEIVDRIAITAGKSVSQEVKNRAAAKLSDKEVIEKRISLLIAIYSAPELARLSELYSNDTDNKLIKKVSVYEDKLRELVSPLVMEVLSNSP